MGAHHTWKHIAYRKMWHLPSGWGKMQTTYSGVSFVEGTWDLLDDYKLLGGLTAHLSFPLLLVLAYLPVSLLLRHVRVELGLARVTSSKVFHSTRPLCLVLPVHCVAYNAANCVQVTDSHANDSSG